MRILLCSSEVVPFAKTGGLADVIGALPNALTALGHDVRVALPKYGSIDTARFGCTPLVDALQVPVGDTIETATVWSCLLPGAQRGEAYLVENDRLFGAGSLYGQPNDAERFIFYQRAVMEMLPALGWIPDVIHCNDWQTGLIPLYMKLQRKNQGPLTTSASVYTVHNLAYQGVFGCDVLRLAGLPNEYYTMNALEFYGGVNLMKAGLLYADIISTVSPTYAQEIQTPEFGERLDGVLTTRQSHLRGILNGIDISIWNPETDQFIKSHYSVTEPKGKAACKRELQTKLGLARKNVPLIALVTRLAAQKGLDILAEALPYILNLDVQLVVLGPGEKPYEELLMRAAEAYPGQVSVNLQFNEELAHQIYAGSDMFLMPSRYEPCGLGQMISLRYGTIPIVRTTGGLADTVDEFDPVTESGNGFRFDAYSPVALLGAVAKALLAYADRPEWRSLVQRAMTRDFSWQASAQRYQEVYQEAREIATDSVTKKTIQVSA